MRWLILLWLLAAIALPAAGAKRETVAQFEQALNAASAAHKSDAEMGRLIASVELSERLSDATRDRLSSHLGAGSRTALALLADQAAFLDLPAIELPDTGDPDEATQQRVLDAARNYVSHLLPRLPNFLATRTINLYDDSPRAVKKGAWPTRAGLHLVGTTSREVSVRDERENQPPAQGSAVWKEQNGLISGGEFGSTLGMILADTEQGKVSWSQWERTAAGQAAVLKYSVPRSASHFEIMGTQQGQAALEGRATSMGGSRGTLGIVVSPAGPHSSKASILRARPGYHGSMWLDPATGTILRVTMEADAKDSGPFRKAAIMVQYAAVEIGGSSFICPVRGLAISMAQVDAESVTGDAPTEWLNETLFTNYHRFASTTRIISDPAPQ